MTLLRLPRLKAILPFFIICTLAHAADPVVSNISAVQRAGTQLVDITYDVTADTTSVFVELAVSSNGGTTYSVPSTTLSGAIGAGVATGVRKVITWNAGADWNNQYSTQTRFKVTATDEILNFALIPGGDFTMGNSVTADTDISDAPPHRVYVNPFYMAKNLVTKADWDTVRTWAISNGYSDLAAGAGKASNHPVQTISWFQMVKWCNARSQQEGLTPVYYTDDAQTTVYKTGDVNVTNAQVKWAANGYRLPTEAQWEKAARGGLSGKRFPWGDTISHSQANYYAMGYSYDLSGAVNNYHPSYTVGGQPYTSPVGGFAANGYGLNDMAGNIWQFCWDVYDSYDTFSSFNPIGPYWSGSRVIRGGAWNSQPVSCRVAYRSNCSSGYAGAFFGFRVARSSVPQ
jgi:formylglycine-generating enzyme required for sulfatase activity